jgi:hypothetical protein
LVLLSALAAVLLEMWLESAKLEEAAIANAENPATKPRISPSKEEAPTGRLIVVEGG